MVGFHFSEAWNIHFASLSPLGTAVKEVTAVSLSVRGWDVSLKNNPLSRTLNLRIGDGNSGEKRSGIRVKRIFIEDCRFGNLHDHAQIHDGHAGTDVADNGKVVGDKEIGQSELILEIVEEVQNL